MARERLSNADTVMLRAEEPSNPIMAAGVMIFSAPMDYERLLETIESRILGIDRFRQRVVQPLIPWASPYWEDDPDFDLRYHVQRIILPEPGDHAALQETVSLLSGFPLEMNKPLWQLHLVESYDPGPQAPTRDGCALICRLHHSLADGLALIQVVLSAADPSPGSSEPAGKPEQPPPQELDRRDPATLPLHSRLRARQHAVGKLVRRTFETLADPSERAEWARLAGVAASTAGRLILLPPDPNTILKGRPSTPKRAAWSEPVALQDIKIIGRRVGGTVNDVLLTAATGALARYLQEQGEWTGGLDIRATVPISLRPPDAVDELGNRIGIVLLPLPVGIADPVERMRELKRRMDRLKGSIEAPLVYHAMRTFGSVPSTIVNAAVGFLGTKATAVVTNVVGPRERLCLAGAPLEVLMFWTPRFGGVGVGVSILSYAGEVRVGIITDEDHVPDPEAIVAAFHAEMDALQSMAREMEQPPSVADLSAMLDETLATLDGMLDTATPGVS